MATGAPDWQGLRWKTEAVNRPNIMYPGGRQIMYDGFDESTLHWKMGGTAGQTGVVSTDQALKGEASMKITTPLGPTANVSAAKYLGLPPTTKIGFQCAFYVGVPNVTDFRFTLDYYAGTKDANAIVLYDYANKKWRYWTSAGAFADIPGGLQDLTEDSAPWQFMKLAVDFGADKYMYLRVNDTVFNLSALSLKTTVEDHAKMLSTIVRFQSANAVRSMYIDEVMITDEG